MVSVSQFEDQYCLFKQISGSELPRCPKFPLRGIKIPLYRFGNQSASVSDVNGGSCVDETEQTPLDCLLLAQWEDHAWKGFLNYDVTNCETKFVHGRRKFTARLSNGLDAKHFADLANHNISKQLDHSKFNCRTTKMEELLFCVATGEMEKPELITSAVVPNDATVVVLNANPIEYGHVFIVPMSGHCLPPLLDARSFEMASQIAFDINNHSFHVFYEYHASSEVSPSYFQACYFANRLSIELAPVAPVTGPWQEMGIQICEVLDYPIKTLLFKSGGNSRVMVAAVSEICSRLQDQHIPFSLLISERSMKMFLFPQVHDPVNTNSLTAWECGGHFVFKVREDFDAVDEETLIKCLAATSLDFEAFEAVKQLSCSTASMLAA